MLLVSDFDGTLAEIVPEPTLAAALPDSLHALRRLVPVLNRVVILSSRTPTELSEHVSVPGALLIGGDISWLDIMALGLIIVAVTLVLARREPAEKDYPAKLRQ